MGEIYDDDDLARWAGVFHNVSDFLVKRHGSQLLLGSGLALRDTDDADLSVEFERAVQELESPYPDGSLADDVWRAQTAAVQLGADFSFDDWSCPVSVDAWKLGRDSLKLSLLQSPLELRR